MALRSAAVIGFGVLTATLVAPLTAPGAAASSAGAAAQQASRVVLHDVTHDVWVIGPGEDDWDPFGAKPTVDLTRAVGRHRAHAVTASLRFVDLRRRGPQDFIVKIRSSEGFRRATVSVGPGDRAGTLTLRDAAYETVACAGLRREVDYATDRVWLRVPRGCLGNPSWVRLKLSAFLFREWTELSDNPHNDGPEPTFTRRLYPG